MLIFTLAVGNFVIGIGAFVVVGLLTPIAEDYGISTSYASLVFAIYAATYAVMSPLLIASSGTYSRRNVLMVAMGLFMVSSLLTAVAPNPTVVFIARGLAALGGCIFTPVAASVAFSASAPERRGRALASVFIGMTAAQALGVPLGTYLGFALGWESVFYLIAAMAAFTIVLIALYVPLTVTFQVNSLGMLLRTAGDWRRVVGVALTTTQFSAMAVLYTFISPVIADLGAHGNEAANVVLLIFGAGAALCSLFIGQVADRFGTRPTMIVAILGQALIMPIFSFLPLPLLLIWIVTLGWALTGPGFMIPQQALLIERSPDRQTIMLALNATANYAGITLGAGLGAIIVHYWGLAPLGIVAGGCGLIAMLNFWIAERLNRKPPAPSPER